MRRLSERLSPEKKEFLQYPWIKCALILSFTFLNSRFVLRKLKHQDQLLLVVCCFLLKKMNCMQKSKDLKLNCKLSCRNTKYTNLQGNGIVYPKKILYKHGSNSSVSTRVCLAISMRWPEKTIFLSDWLCTHCFGMDRPLK